jgi:hypothetical protein
MSERPETCQCCHGSFCELHDEQPAQICAKGDGFIFARPKVLGVLRGDRPRFILHQERQAMKRAKLVFTNKFEGTILLGRDVNLFDADTGEKVDCIGDITIFCPLNGQMRASVDFMISEVEVVEHQEVRSVSKP